MRLGRHVGEWDCRQIESVWANTKNGLGNLAACSANQLTSIVQEPSRADRWFLAYARHVVILSSL